MLFINLEIFDKMFRLDFSPKTDIGMLLLHKYSIIFNNKNKNLFHYVHRIDLTPKMKMIEYEQKYIDEKMCAILSNSYKQKAKYLS